MKRFVLCAVLAALFVVSAAQAAGMKARALEMRTTVAAASVAMAPWTKFRDAAFTDSSVFRKGAATRTLFDTTQAIHTSELPWPPSFYARTAFAAVSDTATSEPWIILKVKPDSVSYSFSGTSGLDSLIVAVEYSEDGVQWVGATGTPTRAFSAEAPIPIASDGITPVPLTKGEPTGAAGDAIWIALQCHPQVAETVGNHAKVIVNRTLCVENTYIRFIIGVADGSGQFKAELLHWDTE